MKYKVSVIIPIYNAEKYLQDCLNSLFNQSLKEIEIICVNDGSTDNSFNILEENAKKHKNLILLNKKNGGVISARIEGLKNASGEFVGWVDADDFVSPSMYEKMYNLAKLKNAETVICNYNFYPKNLSRKKKWFKDIDGKVTWDLISDNVILWNEISKKSLLDKLNISELMLTLGEGVYSLVYINSKKVVTLNENLYYYRIGHSSLSSGFNNINWYKKVIDFNYNKYQYVLDNSYSKYWISYFRYVYLYYVFILMVISAYNDNKTIYNESKKIIYNNDFFSKDNKKYLLNKFSSKKLFIIKNFLCKNYNAMRLASHIILK